MPGTAAKIRVSEQQLVVVSELRRSRSAPKGVVQRASIIELGFRGLRNVQIVDHVKLNRQQVGVWRQRWRDAWEALCVWESNEPHRLREGILEVLSEAPRPGSPGTFTAEQVAQIVALACESPKLSDRPINRWTHQELRDEVVKRQIVSSISVAQVGRYLQQAALAAASLEAVADHDGEERRQIRARGRHGLPDVSRCSAPGRARRDSHGECR